MKKSRLAILGTIIASALTLSGCFLDNYRSSDTSTTVTPPSIVATSSIQLNLLGNNSKSLDPELTNSSTKNPVFEYKSSNTSVATVSSDGVVTGVSVGKCNVVITLQSNKAVTKTVSVEVISKEIDHYKYTLMFYMCASDLEYAEGYSEYQQPYLFTEDIQEMLKVKNIPDSVKIVIETGGTTKWKMPSSYLEGATSISSKALQRWEINNSTNKLKLVQTLSTNYMAKEDSFADFLSWGLDNYEGDQMGVIISGHGGGIAGCAYDDNYTHTSFGDPFPNTLQTFEVAKAAKTALKNSSKEKFTWIGYDCCLMQCADIATINSDYFEYMVASQETENGTGWNHDEYLPELANNPDITPEEFLPKICDAFLKDNHSDGERQKCYQTLSVLDLSKANNLVTSFEAVASSLGDISSAVDTAGAAFNAAYNKFGEAMYGLCDFNSLLNKLHDQEGINVTNAINAVNDMVIYNKYCSKYTTQVCGLNAFFPKCIAKGRDALLQVVKADYTDKEPNTKFTTWQKICLAVEGFE